MRCRGTDLPSSLSLFACRMLDMKNVPCGTCCNRIGHGPLERGPPFRLLSLTPPRAPPSLQSPVRTKPHRPARQSCRLLSLQSCCFTLLHFTIGMRRSAGLIVNLVLSMAFTDSVLQLWQAQHGSMRIDRRMTSRASERKNKACTILKQHILCFSKRIIAMVQSVELSLYHRLSMKIASS